MSDGKRTPPKRDSRRSTSGDALPKPRSTELPRPMELIRFCNEIGMDPFNVELRKRIGSIKSPEDYAALVKEVQHGREYSVEDKLR